MIFGNFGIYRDFMLINEAYNRVYEDAEGRNINRAENYIKKNHPEILNRKLRNGKLLTPRLITQELRNMIPNSRLEKCKFLEGVSRIYLDEMMKSKNQQKMAGLLNQYLKILAEKSYVEKYDNNLNGMSYKDIENTFSSIVKSNLEKDKKELSIKRFVKRNSSQRIVKIRTFKESSRFSKYADWCVCNDERMFDNYTGGKSGIFYFILADGFENAERTVGNGCPFDEYGLSMVAVCVNGDGTLNTCTTRWNHENGGSDYSMTTEEISEFIGGNFYEILKPRGNEELWASHNENKVQDDNISLKLGAIKTQRNGKNTKYVIKRKDGSVEELTVVKRLDNGCTCLAGDMLYWYDGMGNMTMPPIVMNGDLVLHNINSLTSLRGMPRKINGMVVLSELDGLDTLEGMSDEITGRLEISYCTNLQNLDGISSKYKYLNVIGCPSLMRNAA